jgi:ABC-type branched-subunit amino acid transport system substrate-binding protein
MLGSVARLARWDVNRLGALRSCAFFLALVLALGRGGLVRPAAGAPAGIAFGVELPLAGDDGAAGLEARSAIELAVDEHNANAPPGVPALRAVVRDAALHLANPHQDEGTNNAAEPQRAAALMHEFAREPSVVAALGGLRANVAAGEAPAASGLRLPLLVMATLPLACPGGGKGTEPPFAFALSGGAALEALAASRASDARGRRFAVLDNGETVRALVASCLSASLQASGGRIVVRAQAPPGDDAALSRIRGEQRRGAVDAVAYVGPPERGTLVCPAAAAETLERAGALAEMEHRGYDPASVPHSCRWIVPRLLPPAAAYAAFVSRYRQRFLETPSEEAVRAYAATEILAQAIDAAASASPGDLRAGVRSALASGSFETVLGTVRFGPDGGAATAWFDAGSAAPLQVTSEP